MNRGSGLDAGQTKDDLLDPLPRGPQGRDIHLPLAEANLGVGTDELAEVFGRDVIVGRDALEGEDDDAGQVTGEEFFRGRNRRGVTTGPIATTEGWNPQPILGLNSGQDLVGDQLRGEEDGRVGGRAGDVSSRLEDEESSDPATVDAGE